MRWPWKRRRRGPVVGVAGSSARKGESFHVILGPAMTVEPLSQLEHDSWRWPRRPDDEGISDEDFHELTVVEGERFFSLVGLAMAQGYSRGYAERQALALVIEGRSSSGAAGTPGSMRRG